MVDSSTLAPRYLFGVDRTLSNWAMPAYWRSCARRGKHISSLPPTMAGEPSRGSVQINSISTFGHPSSYALGAYLFTCPAHTPRIPLAHFLHLLSLSLSWCNYCSPNLWPVEYRRRSGSCRKPLTKRVPRLWQNSIRVTVTTLTFDCVVSSSPRSYQLSPYVSLKKVKQLKNTVGVASCLLQ